MRRRSAIPVACSTLVTLLGLLLGLVQVACGSGSGASDVVKHYGFYHPPKWVDEHPGQALQRLNSCRQCHSLSGLQVGTGIPNCQTAGCHHRTLPGFHNADLHGLRAKASAGPDGGSLVSCQICHGPTFKGGESTVSCASCHGVEAPHPAKPWRAPEALTHGTTDPSNAPVCAQCHFPGSSNNPSGHPAAPAPAGTAPGCFNNTLCHGDAGAPHTLGAVWKNATSSAFHGYPAKQDLAYCQSCHGTPGTIKFEGGSAATACSSCHLGAKAHSVPWAQAPVSTFPGYVASHRDAGKTATTCTICHDVTKGRTAPNPAAPSCFSATYNANGCHANGPGAPNHPVPFLSLAHTAVTSNAFASDCQHCHAKTRSSPVASAPLCSTCHQAGDPLTVTGCASCHAKPPTGTSFPNVAGLHAKHNALAGVTGVCGACHNGSDTGSQTHYDRANARPGKNGQRVAPAPVAFLPAYNAKSGTATFNTTTQTCSNVSCHGGQTTPSWQGGTINTATQCTACHSSGTTQYNSQNLNGGQHPKHASYACSECHNMTSGANTGATAHFANLGTSAMEGPASATIQFAADVTGARTYNTSTKGCALTCHNETHTAANNKW